MADSVLGDRRRRSSRTIVKGMKEDSGVKKVDHAVLRELYYERENLALDSHICLEPVQRFYKRSNAMGFRSVGDSTSGGDQDKLRTISLCCR